MANEIAVRTSLQVRKGNLTYQSQPTAFNADLTGSKGPTPGSVTVSPAGTNIDLSQLTELGGLCRLMNLDADNFVEYGVWDGAEFYPLGELLPGETYVLRLSRNLEFGEVGTAMLNSLRLRANANDVNVLVEAFDP